MTDLYCQSCGAPVDEHAHTIMPWAVKCADCYYGRLEGPEDRHKGGNGISPLQDPESFAFRIWMQKRQQVEDWQRENGPNVPVELLDECAEWKEIWRARFWREMRDAV